jgi:hypothetical protein
LPLPGSEVAQATPEGLLVTTFRFEVIGTAGQGQVGIAVSAGDYSQTIVLSAIEPGRDVTGALGWSTVTVGGGDPPTAVAEGCRYLYVTPAPGQAAIALVVSGDPGDPSVSCLSKYIQADGSLGATPVYQTPATWGTVLVKDEAIRPSTTYLVQADCGGVPGDPTMVTTWVWGDANDNGVVNLDDILRVLDGFQLVFIPPATLERVDLLGCTPNQAINLDDILAVLDAFQLVPFSVSCGDGCP